MIVVDTSAWVEFLRATGSDVNVAVRGLIDGSEVLVPDVVRMELLAGAASDEKMTELSQFLARFIPLPASSPADHELAASLYRQVRSKGQTVRSMLDCLIAAMALRVDAPLLARDRDFLALSEVSGLRLA